MLEADSHFKRLRFDEIVEAPNTAGIYAWYGLIPAGPLDWKEDLQDGVDRGERNSRRLLRSQTARYQVPALEIEAVGGFSTTWKGNITDTSNEELQGVFDPLDENLNTNRKNDRKAPKLQTTLSSPELRELLFLGLAAATPIFAAPLYIGVATNLRERLNKHAIMLEKLSEVARKRPARLEELLANEKWQNEFAVRAIQRNLSPETVEVWVLPLDELDETGINNDRLRIVAEAIEWLLNRWHRPPLGRR